MLVRLAEEAAPPLVVSEALGAALVEAEVEDHGEDKT